MKTRKLTLVLIAVLALSLSMLGAVSAASRGQDVPADADRTAAADPATTEAVDIVSETDLQAYLGLEVIKLTKPIRRLLEIPDAVDGLVVIGTYPGSPAREAGLQRGDVAMSFDGHTLVEPQQLRRFLNSKAPGDVIEVVYFRDGERHAVKIELGRKPTDQQPRPEWLKQVHVFLRTFPNAVDGSLRLLDDDGEVREFVLTPGEVVRIGEGKIVVENKLGEVNVYEVLDRTVFYARFHQIRPVVVEPGMQVAVLTVNGNLKAVVVTARADGDEPTITDVDPVADLNADRSEVRASMQAEFRTYLNDLRVRLADADVDVDRAAVQERIEKRAAELRLRLANQAEERQAKIEALRERTSNAVSDQDAAA